jgi:hypothetical protein
MGMDDLKITVFTLSITILHNGTVDCMEVLVQPVLDSPKKSKKKRSKQTNKEDK